MKVKIAGEYMNFSVVTSSCFSIVPIGLVQRPSVLRDCVGCSKTP